VSTAVAKVMRDLKTGRVKLNDEIPPDGVENLLGLLHLDKHTSVIDSTPMYEQIVSGPPVDLYGEYTMLPVWMSALIGYENQLGNVNVIQSFALRKDERIVDDRRPPGVRWGRWETENEVDWDAIEYQFVGALWVGGRSPQVGPLPTFGPILRYDIAVYEDGSIADIHWTQLMELKGNDPQTYSQNAMMIWLQTYTLAGCSNVELVTPERSRQQRRHLERMGVVPQTLVIKRTSKSYRHDSTKPLGGDVPQSFVRGHYARYGPEYGRKLLFGKYAGKFWIPAHARGEVERPSREVDYVIDPS
jgi:hypothetical protein